MGVVEEKMAVRQDEAITIIVGAGTSGLATAACLTQQSLPYIILEREDCFASLWKKYAYDRLHLHLPKQVCELPLMKFPSDYPTYVPRNEFLRYLDEYVTRFEINPLYHRCVESAEYDELTKAWKVKARNLNSNEIEEYSGKFLVVSTGESCDPFVPEVPRLDSFSGEVIHSTRYKNGKKYEGKSVLVVGSGNSGMEIAYDLSNYGAKTSIVIRSPLHFLSRGMMRMVPLMAKYIPFNIVEWIVVMLSKLWYGDFTKYGIQRPPEGPFTEFHKYGKYPLIDVGTHRKIKSGEIQVLPAIASVRGNEVVFQDGKSHPFDAIIFATGFRRSTNKWLKGDDYLLNEGGFSKAAPPTQWKGRNGLYCAGLSRRGFFGAARDARSIADDIKALLL